MCNSILEYWESTEFSVSLINSYCDFIIKLSRWNKEISANDLMSKYPFNEFNRFVINCMIDNYQESNYAGWMSMNLAPKREIRYYDDKQIDEIAKIILFLKPFNFKDSTEIVEYFRSKPTLAKSLFPNIMAKFDTNKNDFLGLYPYHIYELICNELKIPIKRGNAILEKITPLRDIN